MPTNTRWLGRATAVAEVQELTFANTWTAGDTATVIYNGKRITVTSTLGTTAEMASLLIAAWNASTDTEFTEVTASAGSTSSKVRLTGDTAGLPIGGLTLAGTIAGSGTFGGATLTAATGPNHVNNVYNWSAGALPTTSDKVYVDNSSTSLLYGWGDLGDTAALFHVMPGFSGQIGLPKKNVTGGYTEHRETAAVFRATKIIVDAPNCQLIRMDGSTVQTAIEIRRTGQSAEDGYETFIWKGTHASSTLEQIDGSTAVAGYGGEVATVLTVNHVGGTLRISDLVTLTTVNSGQGGTVSIGCNVTTLNQYNGSDVTISGVATLGTGTLEGGVLRYNSGGNATAIVLNGGLLDMKGDGSAFTVGTLTLNGGEFDDPSHRMTATAIARGANIRGLGSLAA